MLLRYVGSYKQPHGVTFQKTAFFTFIAAKTSDLTIALTGWVLSRRRDMFPVRYEVGFYIPEDEVLHNHSCENLRSYIELTGWSL
jgi:hypothetical protein